MCVRVVLTIAAAAGLLSAGDFKEIKKIVPLKPGGRVSVDTYKGSVQVSTWDRSEVDIVARIEPDGGWMAEPVEDTDVRIDAVSDSVRIKTDYHRAQSWFRVPGNLPLVRYVIRMPRNANLSIKEYKSETQIENIAGDVEMDTYKGTVRIRNLAGGLNLKTYKGEVRAEFASFTARSRFETYRGMIELRLPRDSKFDLHADLGRHAELDSDFPQYVRSTGRRESEFRGAVNGGGPDLRLKSYRGTFRLRTTG